MDTTPNRGYDIPDSPTALFPQLRGTLLQIDSDIEGLDNENPLISTGAIIIGADSDASGADGIQLQTRGTNRLVVSNDGTITIGDSSVDEAARLDLKTNSTILVSLKTQTFDFVGTGPGGASYANHTFGLFYNEAEVAGDPTFSLAHEPKFSQGGLPYQTEIYYSWEDPTHSFDLRPWGMVIQHADGDNVFTMQGDIAYFAQLGDGGAQTAQWHAAGFLEFAVAASSAQIQFPNNTPSIVGYNAAHSSAFGLIKMNASDKVEIDSGGLGAVFGAGATANTFTAGEFRHSATPTTLIDFAFANVMVLTADGNIVAAISGTDFQLRKPLVWETDNTTDIGKLSGSSLRPRDIYIGRDIYAGGVLIVGSGPTTLTDSAGKILSAALNTVAVGQGGTGLTAPGTSGNVLTSNGSAWVSSAPAGGGGSPGGSDTHVQFNNAGAFDGSANLKWASGAMSVKKDGSTATSLDSTAALRVGAITDTTTFVMGAEPSVATYIQSMEAGVSYTNRPLGFNPLGGKVGFGTPLADISEQYTFKMLDGYKMFFYRSAGIGGVIRFDNTGGVEGVDYGYDDGGGFKSRLRINERNTDIVLCKDGGYTIVKSANAAPTDSRLIAASVAMYLDESNNKLKFRVKYSDGSTLKTGEIALT